MLAWKGRVRHSVVAFSPPDAVYLTSMSADLSNVDPREIAALLKLRESIDRLKGLQMTAENLAGVNGMTAGESKQYRMRHKLITRLTQQLLDLENGG